MDRSALIASRGLLDSVDGPDGAAHRLGDLLRILAGFEPSKNLASFLGVEPGKVATRTSRTIAVPIIGS
jgi:hypothetical protein